MNLTIISYGGGIQSTAMLVLAAQGTIPNVTAAVFANTGDDSENPATLDYLNTHARPYATAHDIPIIEVQREPWPTGDPKTLLSYLDAYNGCQACGTGPEDDCVPDCPSTNNTGGDLPIPMKLTPSGAPVQRSCTNHWKIEPIRRWLIEHGATPTNPATVLIGISIDEIHRATNKPRHPAEQAQYPLLDLHISRQDCTRIIVEAGLPTPPHSACWFCPFHPERSWSERRSTDPATYWRAVELEEQLNRQRQRRHLQPVQFLTKKPLRAVDLPQPTLFDDFDAGSCDDGYCWT